MSSTDAALDWLFSLSATFTSSPVPNSDAPDFTDWLQVSPTSSLTSEAPFSTPPFQDVTCSSRVNVPQQEQAKDIDITCLRDDLYFSSDLGGTSASQSGRNARDLNRNGQLANSAQLSMFNDHHRMISMDSTTATLVNTPSPRPRILAPGPTNLDRAEPDARSPFSSSLLWSPGTKLLQELQNTSFGSYFSDIAVSSLSVKATADDSPVVRAADLQGRHLSDDRSPSTKPKSKSKTKNSKKSRCAKAGKPPLSFVDQLRATENPATQPTHLGMASQSMSDPSNELRLPLSAIPTPAMPDTVLMSPCRIKFKQSTPHRSDHIVKLSNSPAMKLTSSTSQTIKESPPATPSNPLISIEAFSPLTPLPSLPNSPDPLPRLKIVLNLKREPPTEDWEPFLRRGKRPRRAMAIIESPPSTTNSSPMQSPAPSQEPSTEDGAVAYTTRTLPSTIEISDNFPLFYRRYPVSSYYQHEEATSPCTLFKVHHPGGIYNPPRSALDLYTPRFVKGRGVEKVGLCPICIESRARGGAGKKLWLAMKFSAFKCYHMQYAHGISASMGRPFSPPTAFRVIPRPNAGKREKLQIQQGKCHKCRKWVAVEGIKDMESKVKELHWWKHAAACHQESTLDGEDHYYEDDHVLSVICSLSADPEQSAVV